MNAINASIDWKLLSLRAWIEEECRHGINLLKKPGNPLWKDLAGLTPEQIETRYKQDSEFRKKIHALMQEIHEIR